MDFDEEGCVRLANAIIILAAKDYRRALKQKSKNKNSKTADKQLKEIEEFFHSHWYSCLTEVPADTILTGLRQEVNG